METAIELLFDGKQAYKCVCKLITNLVWNTVIINYANVKIMCNWGLLRAQMHAKLSTCRDGVQCIHSLWTKKRSRSRADRLSEVCTSHWAAQTDSLLQFDKNTKPYHAFNFSLFNSNAAKHNIKNLLCYYEYILNIFSGHHSLMNGKHWNPFVAVNVDTVAGRHKQINVWETLQQANFIYCKIKSNNSDL